MGIFDGMKDKAEELLSGRSDEVADRARDAGGDNALANEGIDRAEERFGGGARDVGAGQGGLASEGAEGDLGGLAENAGLGDQSSLGTDDTGLGDQSSLGTDDAGLGDQGGLDTSQDDFAQESGLGSLGTDQGGLSDQGGYGTEEGGLGGLGADTESGQDAGLTGEGSAFGDETQR